MPQATLDGYNDAVNLNSRNQHFINISWPPLQWLATQFIVPDFHILSINFPVNFTFQVYTNRPTNPEKCSFKNKKLLIQKNQMIRSTK